MSTETIIALRNLKKVFDDKGTRVLDRGYDSNTIFEELIKSKVNFIVRCKQNRDIYYKDKKINILSFANKGKGKYVLNFKNKCGKEAYCKVSILSIELPNFRGIKLNLVVCHGFGMKPLILITNITNDDKKICTSITKAYLLRWRIEEYYRLKKEHFGFEDIRVRSLRSIRNLSTILNMALGFLAFLGENWLKVN
ncbi:MAG: transposase [Firmicutes bacterium]|nr:transposase [Bacillota bacterium]